MPKKILLADDSITIQKVVELTFSDGDYEVIAVNNGAKAIQKLSEMRPDIILSDIIMPEKNGYEVCEYVKSHPEFRTIPVVLLTGTFEPFDPDRADKAGCDAVVTKPFESQSLIHKVEELVNASHAAPPPSVAAEAPASAAESPWSDEAAPAEQPFAGGFAPHGNDIFGAAPTAPSAPTTEMPFETAAPEAFSGETRAFPRMSFEDMQKMANETSPSPTPAPIPPSPPPAEPPQIESSPWDEQPPAFGGGAAEPSPWSSEPEPPASPFGEEAPAFSGETKAFPRMSFEEMQRMAAETAPPAAPTPPPEPPPVAPPQEASPWEEPAPAFSGETKAFPRMSFEELSQMASQTPMPQPEPSAPEPPTWSKPAASPFGSEAPVEAEAPRSDSSLWSEPAAAPSWSAPAPAPEPEPQSPFAAEPEVEPTPAPQPSAPAAAASAPVNVGDLTEEQIDRIARRVVQLLSADVVKNIAWEVIPDMAEMVVKERIRQLESEA